jgi:hypothetical protein
MRGELLAAIASYTGYFRHHRQRAGAGVRSDHRGQIYVPAAAAGEADA